MRLTWSGIGPTSKPKTSYDVTLGRWEQEVEKVWATQEDLERKAQEDLDRYKRTAEADWEAECTKVEDARTKWTAAEERYAVARTGLFTQYTKDLGFIWEYTDKALPRAVNGCPMFTSCRLMGKKDTGRAIEAIHREMERRKSFKI